ncbi:phage tail tape measure protein, partial [Bacteroides sp. HMSC067B03]
GIALRNTIVKLQAPTTDAIKQLKAAGVNIKTMQDQSLSLTDRLRALTPVMHNATIMSALFGSENLASTMALIEGVDQI